VVLGSAAAWPLAARAQQTALPVIGVAIAGSDDAAAGHAAAFRKGLGETGYFDGRNVTIEREQRSANYDPLNSQKQRR
jgi:putative tryptophan/tyrosine transport system substrate-binding protein